MIKLGDEVKDKITGFKGVAVSIADWLNGCRRVGIQPKKLDEKGKPGEIEWFDIEQVEAIKKKAVKKSKRSGGPTPNPVRRGDAR